MLYTPEEVLRTVAGLSRDILHRWIDAGYIASTLAPVVDEESPPAEEFSEEAIRKIKLMWVLHRKQGLSPQDASEKADQLLRHSRDLKMTVGKTYQQDIPLISSALHLSPGASFQVIATLEIYQIERWNVSVSFDSQHLCLESGDRNRPFTLDDIYDQVDVCWTFRANQATGEEVTYMEIKSQGGGAPQVASIPVKIGDNYDS